MNFKSHFPQNCVNICSVFVYIFSLAKAIMSYIIEWFRAISKIFGEDKDHLSINIYHLMLEVDYGRNNYNN